MNTSAPNEPLPIAGLSEVIRRRASHRKYLPDRVPDEDVRRIVENALHAPSGHNRQPWRYIAIRDAALLERMGDAAIAAQRAFYDRLSDDLVRRLTNFEFYVQHFRTAPLVLAVLVRYDTDPLSDIQTAPGIQFTRPEHYDTELLGVGASIQNCLLTAEELGYGTCWLTAPVSLAQREFENLLEVPEGFNLVSLIAVGRPTRSRAPAPKKGIEEMLEFRP